MAERDTNNFLHILEAPGSVENYKLFRMSGEEKISEPFRFRLQIRSHGEIPPAQAWINASITFALGTSDMDESRRINGRCARFEHIHQKGAYVEFAIEVAPAFEALTLTRDRRLFTDRSARQVVAQLLAEHGVPFDDAKYGASPTRPYIVQQDESDFAFISRLIEDEGVFYYFRFDEGAAPYKHRMVLAGDTSGYYDGSPFEASFRRDHLLRGLHDLQMGYDSAPAKVVTHDYDFQKPGNLTPVTAPSKLDWSARSGQVYRYAEDYTDPGQGRERAKLRIEREEAGAVTMKGQGSYVAFAPAARFNVDDPRLDPRERRIVVRSVSHDAFDPYGGDEGEPSYDQSFEAQPSAQTYRPQRRTARAASRGPQTAVVLDQNDPEGHGRIKVKFHWDRTGASTAWVRVLQQWAGSQMGAQFVPRPGMEVLVDFIEGRLDRPVVVGCLYNGQNKHSFGLPSNLSQTGFRTFGDGGLVHELFFEDKGGGERVYLRSGRDFARDVARNESAHVQQLSETTIGTTSRTFSGGKMLIESAEAITIKVGGSSITIDAGGIWIDAPQVHLNSGGAPNHDVPAVTAAGQAAVAGAASSSAAAAPTPRAADAPGAGNRNAGKAGVGGVGGGGSSGGGAAAAAGAKGPATKPVTAMGIDKKFGAETAALAGKSPGLGKDMAALQKEGWTTRYGPAGGGTSANRAKKLILIDKNQAGNPQAIVQSLSHEVGHARYTGAIDMASKAKYVQSTLADEGAATISNIRARREILTAGGKDIGIAGNAANQPAYNKAYDAFLKDGDAAKARDAIGAIYGKGEHTSTTGQTYADYYGSWYDKVFTPKK